MKNPLLKETFSYKKLRKRSFRSLCFSLMMMVFSIVQAQEIEINGQVTSPLDPEGVPGVNVSIKGTSRGTITDLTGNYTISVPSNESSLVFSFVGFESQTILVGSRATINVTLEATTQSLSEVVVTALGVERDVKALGYAVQEVEGDELTTARETNVVNSLSGRIAGVQITNGSSGVGSSSLITIRGESSLIPGNNSPLFVVDGIPISNETFANRSEGNLETDYGNGAQDINPDDVANISVLKGANATALYGARGANGVILITTKSGKGTRGIGISVNSNVTFERPLRLPKYQNEYGQGAGFEFEFGDGFGGGINDNIDESWGPRLDGRLIKQHDSPTTNGFRAGDSHPTIDRGDITATPWVSRPNNIEDFFETGVTLTNNIALTGGNDFGNFRLSVTDLDNSGILPNTDYNRRTYALNAEYNLTERLKASASVNYVNAGSNNRPNNSYGTENIMYLWVWFGRQIDMNSLRDYWQPGLEGVQQYNYNYNWHDNPYLTMFENTNAFDKDRLIGNIKLTYDITDDLNLMIRTGTDYSSELRTGKRAFSSQRFANGQFREDNLFFKEINTDLLLNFNKTINNDFSFSVSAGVNRRDVEDRYKRTSANALSIPNVYNFENSLIPLAINQFNSEKRVNSVYGFANLSFKNMIFLDVTGRNDWSSTLPADNNSYFYPSVSLSGIVTDLLDISAASPLSFAKVRLGWAQVGNDTDPYRLRDVFNFQQPFGATPIASESGTINNSALKPEQVSSFEIGADLRFFGGRIGVDITYYRSESRNQILNLPVDITSGYNSRIINAGKIENKGVEIMLNATPVKINEDFQWDISVNYTRNRSKVLELTDGLDTYTISSNYMQIVAKVGERMGDMYGTGFLETEDGQVIHDEDGFSIRDNTLKKLGNYNPDFMVGISNGFRYKNFNLGVLFDWRQGGEIMSRTVLIGGTSGMMDFTVEGREEGIISPGVIANDDGTFRPNDVRLSGRDYYWWTYNRGNEEVGIFDASYLKLRELKFGFTLPNKWLSGLPFKDVNISVVGRNLALWTENPHFDPESISFNGGTIVPGVEDMALPSSRSIGFNISFKL